MKLVEGSIRRPVTVFMVTLGVVLFGLVAASRLSVDLLPDISYPSLNVRTDFPDANPRFRGRIHWRRGESPTFEEVAPLS